MLSLVDKGIVAIMKGLIIAASLVIVTSIVVEVFFRYVLSRPIWGAEEIDVSALLWLWFISIAYATYRRFHVGSTFPIRKRLAQDIFSVVSPTFCLIVTVISCYYAYRYACFTVAQELTNTVFGFPMIYVNVAAFVGLVLVACYLIRDIVAQILILRSRGKEIQQ
jgi:TRAP-type C4-dicarboxylate transport system permease small subunit